ncbi:MAG: DUF6056 family protein [Brevefilum sp.]|jgi:hypothetical protein
MHSLIVLKKYFEKLTHNRKTIIWGLFLLFLAVMLLQHACIHLYHDDYGYATLSYLGDFNEEIRGHQFNFNQMLTFLKAHYLTWGGRVIPIFTLVAMLRWDFWVFRMMQSLVLTAILYFSMRMVTGKDAPETKKILDSLILMCLFGTIPIQMHKDGTYWATASLIFVWPFLGLFFAGFLLQEHNERLQNKWLLALLVFLFLMIGMTQEQFVIVVFFMLFGFLVAHLIQEKRALIKADLLCLLAFSIGATVLFLAPGNFVRANNAIYAAFYNLSVPERINRNIPALLRIVFAKQNYPIFIIFLVTNILYLTPFIVKEKRMRTPYIALAAAQAMFLLPLVIFFTVSLMRGSLPLLNHTMVWLTQELFRSLFFWLLLILVMSIPVCLHCFQQRSLPILGIYLGGVLSQFTILFLPSENYRMALIFVFSIFPVLAGMLAHAVEGIQPIALKKIILGLLLAGAVVNMGTNLFGYQRNDPIHRLNQQTLISVQHNISRGQEIGTINLQKLENDLYTGAMPAMQGYEYINKWIKKYYRIPMEIELHWE